MIALQILFVVFLIVANGFFVAAEFALVKVRLGQIEVLADEGKWTAKITQNILAHLDAYLSACQLGITLASLALGWVGEPLVAHSLAPIFEWFDVPENMTHYISVAVAFSLITFLHITVGEQAPKILAIQKSQTVALASAPILMVFYQVFRPAIWFLNASSNLILRMVGLEGMDEHGSAHSEEELRLILIESTQGGSLSLGERRLMENVLDLEEKTVHQVLLPRSDIVFLDDEQPLENNLDIVARSGHTRFPLCRGGLDSVIGMVHAKRLLQALIDEEENVQSLGDVASDVIFIPDSARLDSLLKQFLVEHNHLAMVVDEFGSVSGMITFEDVLEEIVGPIQDEFDSETPPLRKLPNGHWMVDAICPLPIIATQSQITFPEARADTMGGLVSETFGRIPEIGEELEIDGHRIIVRAASATRVDRLELIPTATLETAATTSSGDQPATADDTPAEA